MKELLIPILVFALLAYLLYFWFWCEVFCASQNPFGKYKLYILKKQGCSECYYAKVWCGRLFGLFPIWTRFEQYEYIGSAVSKVITSWESQEELENRLKKVYLAYKNLGKDVEKDEFIISKNLEQDYFKN